MSDYINRDDVLAVIEELKKDYPTHSVPDAEARVALRKVADKVKNLPTIDLVQCEECKYKYLYKSVWECPYGLMITADGYCNYGERKESE